MSARAELAENLLALLDMTGTPTFVLAHDRTFRYANASALELLGLGAQAVGSDARAALPDGLREPVFAAVDRVMEQGRAEDVPPDAHTGLGARVLPLPIGVVVVLRDSDARRTTDELRRQRDLYQQLIDQSPSALSLRDLDSRFLLVNRAAAEIIGRPAEDIVGHTVHEVFGPDHGERFRGTDLEVHRRRATQDHEPVMLYQGGRGRELLAQVFPVFDPDGAVSRVGTVITDVASVSALEAELACAQERYRQAFSSTSLGLLLIRADQSVLEANAAACRILGYSRAQLLTLQGPDLVRRSDADLAFLRSQVLEDGLAGYEVEDELVRSDGRLVPVLLTVNTFPDPTGDGHLVSVLMRDLSRERELRDRAVQAERLEATGRLAAGVAHDSNNILAAVSGYTEMLADVVADLPEAQRHLAGIRRSIAKAGEMVSGLLAFTRGLHLDTAPVDLADIAADLEDMLRRLLPLHVHLAVDTAPAPTVADASQLRQVLLNLVVNAGHACTAGGTVQVLTGIEQVEDDDVLLPPGHYACLAVADDGDGMEQHVARRCFEPFFSTRVPQGGTGLGLSTALGIARQNSGDLRVHTVPGHGATFRLLLPMAAPGRSMPEHGGEQTSAAAGRGGRAGRRPDVVLVADDDDAVRELVVEVLRRGGHDVREASDGRSALHIDVVPDLLITDVEMPHVGGPELARALRARRPGLPVLYLTGEPSPSVRPPAPVLRKPFSVDELLHAVATLVGRSL